MADFGRRKKTSNYFHKKLDKLKKFSTFAIPNERELIDG
jgi:hypothetical protein